MNNYCTKCASFYAHPGTCNCYAPVRDLSPLPIYPYPQPWPPFVPYIGDPPYTPVTHPGYVPWYQTTTACPLTWGQIHGYSGHQT
jgi:hypothetical protein